MWEVFDIDGGDVRPVAALSSSDIPLYWSRDDRYVYVADSFLLPVDIWQVDLDSGQRDLWQQVHPPNLAGVSSLGNIKLVAEVDAYVAAYMRVLSELYLVEGLR